MNYAESKTLPQANGVSGRIQKEIFRAMNDSKIAIIKNIIAKETHYEY